MNVSWKLEKGVLSLADESGRVLSLDLEGRLIYFTTGNATYRRTILNKFVKMRIEKGIRRVSPVPPSEARVVISEAFETVDGVLKSDCPSDLKRNLSELLERINYEWLSRDAEKFISVYGGGVPIIPPDQYFTIYVRYADGCPWNRCTFCRLYPGVRYRTRSVEEVESQLILLIKLLGRGIESRRSVFLGDANAVNTEIDRLVEVLRTVRKHIHLPLYAFSDAFTTPRNKGIDEYTVMKKNGLERIYIGIESGDEEVLRVLNKPMVLSLAKKEIEEIKAAGIGVGLIVMSGAGGRKLAGQHIENTSRFLSTLPLGRGDIVYISPINEYEGSDYAKIVEEEGLGEMSMEEKGQQADEIRNRLDELWRKIHNSLPEFAVAPYLLEESIY